MLGDQRWLMKAHHAIYVGALHSGFVNQFTYTGSPYSERYRARVDNMAATYAQITDFSATSAAWDISAAGFVSAGGGPTQFVDKNVKAPYSQETSLSLRHTYANGSFINFTYANRQYKDFYNDFLNFGDEYSFTPKFSNSTQNLYNYRWYWTTDPRIKRELKSLELEWLFNLNTEWSLGGNWTHATLGGNGEGSDSTATSTTVGDVLGDFDDWYKYAGIGVDKYYPDGYLRGDVRNKGLVYLNYVHRTASKAQFTASLMFNYIGGQPWSLTRTTDRAASMGAYYDSLVAQGETLNITRANYAANSAWTQFYTPRGFMRTNDYFNYDLKLGYDVPLVSKVRFFTEVTVFNVFNHWQTTNFRTTTAGGSATSLTDPLGGYRVAPWTNTSSGWTGWGTKDFNDFVGGRSVRLSLGFKW
jgi:hypothetical protein